MNELAKSPAELINTINSGANGLGGAMKTHAPESWRAAVYQSQLTGYTDIASIVCLNLLLGISLTWLIRKAKDDEFEPTYVVPAVIVGIFLVMAIIIAACVVPSDITKILNPEHEAALQLATRFLGK